MKEKILVADDDTDIREMLCTYFSKEGYETTAVEDGIEALEVLKTENISLVLLDIMMPRLDGYETIVKMREFTEVPVIFLTAKGQQMDKVIGFMKGCDDYVVKPFDFAELSFRIRAILKRTGNAPAEEEASVIRVKDLEINLKEHSVKKEDKIIKLTPTEFEILWLLASNKGRVYSTRIIYELIWKDTFFENDNSVLVHIRHIREKLGDKGKDNQYIKTIWGVGYKIEKDN